MLTYLKVSNLAIVEHFEIEPGPGLNVLTGETGAGKSLLIDSLDFLRGGRGSSEMIRSGQEKMTTEAVFHLPETLKESLQAAGLTVESDGGELELIVRREIATTGRGRVLVNGSPTSVRELTNTMDQVLEIHGQSEARDRVVGQTYRELIDQFSQNEMLLGRTRQNHSLWRKRASESQQLRNAQRDRSLRLDLLKYQIDEIASAHVSAGEEDELRAEREILAHAQEMIEASAGAYRLLEEEEDAALPLIARAAHLLQPLESRIPAVTQIYSDLEETRYRLQEIARSLASLSDSVRHDPARLDIVEERLSLLERLKKKYGHSLAAVLDHHDAISLEHEQLTDFEGHLSKLEALEQSTFNAYHQAATELSLNRKRNAGELEKAVRSELDDLAMQGTSVQVIVSSEGNAAASSEELSRNGPDGFDRIEILIAPNRGEQARPMQKIASGGELSRMQLAIAAALFKHSPRSAAASLIFDEIDAGIGGRVAEVVGRKLRDLASSNQVLCVTHLPQIASFGTTHFKVWKEEYQGHTRARIQPLVEEQDRIEEIARMLGGTTVTESARNHAAELLQQARGPLSGKPDRVAAVRKNR